MLTPSDLRNVARMRLKDAEALYRAKRYEGAVYLAGYAVEVSLKARIVRTLRWAGWPETNQEWSGRGALKSHDFNTLLAFTAVEAHVKSNYLPEWSTVVVWGPEIRYRPTSTTTPADAQVMIQAARSLTNYLCQI